MFYTSFFFFKNTATPKIYTLSLHDALPIWFPPLPHDRFVPRLAGGLPPHRPDRKSTRLNSSHQIISYAVFCLKKKRNSRPDRFHPWLQHIGVCVLSRGHVARLRSKALSVVV